MNIFDVAKISPIEFNYDISCVKYNQLHNHKKDQQSSLEKNDLATVFSTLNWRKIQINRKQRNGL